MSEETLIEQTESENLKDISRILAQIREAEALAAAGKNALIAMGYTPTRVGNAVHDRHLLPCAVRTLTRADGGCDCYSVARLVAKPEQAFTEEIF